MKNQKEKLSNQFHSPLQQGLTENNKILDIENYKMLMKEIKDDTNR